MTSVLSSNPHYNLFGWNVLMLDYRRSARMGYKTECEMFYKSLSTSTHREGESQTHTLGDL